MKKGFFRDNLIYFVLFTAILLQAVDYFYAGNNNEYNTFYTQGIEPNFVLTGYNDKTIPTEEELLSGKSNIEIFNYYVENQTYIMHAGGEINGINYTNSYDALDTNYKKGNRIFEIDLNFTSDDHLVLVHGWTKYDYKNRLGIEYDSDNLVMSLNDFKNSLLHNKYQTMSIEDLINFMKSHPYSYFILNLKKGSKESVSLKGLKQIVKVANNDSSILNRLVIWGYNTKIISLAKKIYNFELITFSYNSPDSMPKKVNTKKKIIAYCKKNNITSLIYSISSFDEEMAKLANEAGIYSFVFTTDKEEVAKSYLNKGASMVLTNKLKN